MSPDRVRGRSRRLLIGGAIVVVALAAIVAIAGFATRKQALDKTFVYYTVKPTTLPISVTERGTLESQVNVDIKCEVDDIPGDGINGTPILWIAENGSQVKKSDLLVELDSTSHLERLDDQILATERARNLEVQATNNYENRKALNQTSLSKAGLDLQLAKLAYEQYENNEGGGTYQINLQDIELAIAQTRERSDIETRNLVGVQKLHQLGYKGKGDLIQAELAELQAKNALQRQQARKVELMQFIHLKRTKQLQGALDSGQRRVKQVKMNNEAYLRQAEVRMNSAIRRLQREEERLARYKEQLKKCKIYAPQDGMVAYAVQSSRWGRSSSPIAEGEAVRDRQQIMTLPDLKHMQVKTSVHESVVDHVNVSQQATVRLDAFPDRVYGGTVKTVAVLPDPGGWLSSNVKVYQTTVMIDQDVAQLKPGMTAVVEIHIANLRNILAIPVQAVVQRGEETWCYVSRDGDVVKQPIQVGQTNDKHVQIVKGLSTGDTVILNPSAVLGDERSVEPAGLAEDDTQKVALD